MSFIQTQSGYKVLAHPANKRLYHIELKNSIIQQFLQVYSGTSTQHLEYTPYFRFIMAGKLRELLGEGFLETVRGILNDRQSGGFTIGVQGQTTNLDDYVKFGTAISYLAGPANFDSMSGTYYARFVVKDTDNSDSYLRQAYRLFTLHTDGTFVDEPTDFLLMMKMEERNAVGGESRLLHLDDWEELDKYANHPLAAYKFTYKSPSSKNVSQTVHRQTFFKVNNEPCICFIDQFAYPESIEQSEYLKNMSDSLEASPATSALSLPEGDLVMLNNLFWMHGRAAFEKNTELYRELMRIRGEFAKS
jgi:protein CsiD